MRVDFNLQCLSFLIITDHEEVSAEKSKFMQGFTSTSAFTKTDNILQLKELGAVLAEKVLKFWMGNIHRTLTNYQVRHLSLLFVVQCQCVLEYLYL